MRKLTVFLIVIFISNIINAQETSEQTEQQASIPSSEKDIERVEVNGVKPLSFYLNAMLDAEHEFYDAFNKTHDIKNYKITCKRVALPNSKIKQNVCEPLLVANLRQEAFQDGLDRAGGSNILSGAAFADDGVVLEYQIQQEKAAMRTFMLKRLQSYPDVKDQLIAWDKAKKEYEKKKSGR